MKIDLHINTTNPSWLRKQYRKLISKLGKTVCGKTVLNCIDMLLISKGFINELKILPIQSLREFCKNEKIEMHEIEKKQLRDICIPSYDLKDNTIITVQSPNVFFTLLNNVNVMGKCNCIFNDKYCVYPIEGINKESKIDFHFDGMLFVNDKKICFGYNRKKEMIEKAILLLDQASYNFYHLTVEILARLTYIDSQEEYRRYPLLIDKDVTKIPQYNDMINKINIYKHPIITIEKMSMYYVKEVVVISPNTWMPINIKKNFTYVPEDFGISKQSLFNIKERVPCSVMKKEKYIFLSRENTTNARLINEDKIRDIFEKFNFEIVFPELLSYEQQVDLFGQAECIAGATGAAFTNMLYCNKNTKIICIIPKKMRFYGFSTMAHLLELKPNFIDAEIIEENDNISLSRYHLNEEVCTQRLQKIMIREV